jgi:hypothetical protein
VNRKLLDRAITDALRPDAWLKQKDHWYLDKEQVICVINLQKAKYGGKFYINIAVFLKSCIAVSDDFASDRLQEMYECIREYYDYPRDYLLGKFPRENQCDIRIRLERLLADAGDFNLALDLENSSVTDRYRVAAVSHVIEAYALPFFSQIDSLTSLRNYYHKAIIKNGFWMITLKAREFLEGVLTEPELPWKPKPGQPVF